MLYGKFGQLHWFLYSLFTVVDLFCVCDCRWVWSEAGQQMELEAALGIGGFGYPVCFSTFTLIYCAITCVKLLGSTLEEKHNLKKKYFHYIYVGCVLCNA